MSNIKDLPPLENIHNQQIFSSSSHENVEANSASSSEITNYNNIIECISESDNASSIENPFDTLNNTFPKIESVENGYCHILNSDENIILRRDNYHEQMADNRSVEYGSSSNQLDSHALIRRNVERNIRSSTKEEKQRQNEEIVVLESSSISSETGSWEALFPGSCNNAGLKDICKQFLSQEKLHCADNHSYSYNIFEHETRKPASTACFIDASTLFDENELASISSRSPTHITNNEVLPDLETKLTEHQNERISSNFTSPTDIGTAIMYEANDGVLQDDHLQKELEQLKFDTNNELSSSYPDTKSFKSQSENEKLQGQHLFNNSIQQFSGHLISPKIACSHDDESSYNYPLNSLPSSDDRLVFPETPHNSIIQIAKGILYYMYIMLYYVLHKIYIFLSNL